MPLTISERSKRRDKSPQLECTLRSSEAIFTIPSRPTSRVYVTKVKFRFVFSSAWQQNDSETIYFYMQCKEEIPLVLILSITVKFKDQ